MRTRALLATVGAVLTVALVASLFAGVWWAHDGGAAATTRGDGLTAAAPADPGDDEADGRRGGPPPWAKSAGKDHRSKASLDKWKALSPREKKSLMKRLTAEHDAGMKEFASCREEGRDDCVKPLPPGLAKRQ